MSYLVYDNGSSIKIVLEQDGSELTLLKSFIKELSIVREDVIKIGGDCCNCNFYFRHQDVSYPVTANQVELINVISQWITGYDPTPPNE
ncbi:MAG: hypothetical protein JNK27_08695 [Chitinophagaceae bacterium]|nr:hypothetical protein [Chitinophagaceae bacterium]